MKSLNEKKVLLAECSQLKTERLLLTPLSLLHLSDYHEYISDDETLRFEFFPTKNIQESKGSLVNWNITSPLGRYALVLKKNYKMIGHISLTLNEERNSAFVGYSLNKRYWNKGYATEALKEIVSLSFNTLNLSELEADFISENIGSQKVLEKNGFTVLNRIKQKTSLRGQLVDYSNAKLFKEDIIN